MNDPKHNKLIAGIEELFYKNKHNVLQVAHGHKTKNGVFTGEKSIRFGVLKKLSTEHIPASALIPPTVTIDGVVYKTDVYEAPEEVFSVPTYCYNAGTNTLPPTAPAPVSYNRALTRPLSGGLSISSPPPTGYVDAGTLGGMVVDLFDGKIVGLTNAHVGSEPGGSIYEAQVPQCIASNTTFGATASAYSYIPIQQPSSLDNYPNAAHNIGSMKRSYPLNPSGTNYIDATVLNFTDSVISTTSWFPLCASFFVPPIFATTAEIDGLNSGDPVFKSGRTTGPVGALNACGLIVSNTSTTLNVSYGFATLTFSDCLSITSPSTNTVVGSAGDSGSFVYATINATNPATSAIRIVGLFFAGDSTGALGIACRIDNVAALLSLSAYTGTPVTATPSLCSYVTLPYSTYSNTISTVIDGKIYWQVGRI